MKQELTNVLVVKVRETGIKFFGKISLHFLLLHQPLTFSMDKFVEKMKYSLILFFLAWLQLFND